MAITAGKGYAFTGKNGVCGMGAPDPYRQSSDPVTVMTSDSSAIRLGEATTVTMALGAVITRIVVRLVADFTGPDIATGNIEVR